MRDNIINSTKSARRGKEAVLVDREKMRKQRYKKVNNGKGKKIGSFEAICLNIRGFCDGRNGFPRQTDSNDWYSPFMNQEANSFGEFCSHTWGSLQIENEGEYARLEELMDGISQKKGLLEMAKADLAVVATRENDSEFARKKGEDNLPVKKKVADLEQELKNAEEAFSALHSKLVEDDNTTRLICHRVRDHILMRLDVYWNSALRRHPDGASMPVVPVIELEDEAEEAYLSLHKVLMKRAAAIRDAIQDEAAEKEVA